METEQLKAATLNRERLAATLRTATGIEALQTVGCIASTDIRYLSDRTALRHTKHSDRLTQQVELAFQSFRQTVVALAMAEAARLEEEFSNL